MKYLMINAQSGNQDFGSIPSGVMKICQIIQIIFTIILLNMALLVMPIDYPYSSFKEFVSDGVYSKDWGKKVEIQIAGEPN